MTTGLIKACLHIRLTLFLGVLLLFQSGCQSIWMATSRGGDIQAILFQYQEALNHREANWLSNLLADEVRIDGMTDELSRAGLEAGMLWPPSPIAHFQILSTSWKDRKTEVKVAFFLSNAVIIMRVGFDESLLISSIDYVPMRRPPQAKVSKSFSTPFIENNGLLFVRARINDRTGYFLVDTGSTGLLLNRKYFSGSSRNELPGLTSTVRGIRPRQGSCGVRSFQWGGLRADGIRGQLHDFSAMEVPATTPLLGAVGHEQLKNCAVVFDWQNKRIVVHPAGVHTGKEEGSRSPRTVIAFSYFLHAPAFPVRIGNTTCRMIFDSGAQINLIPNLHGIESDFRTVEAMTKISDGGPFGKETARLGLIDETRIGDISFHDLPFAVFEVPYLSGQGILGSPIIQKGLLEIDFPKKTISIW